MSECDWKDCPQPPKWISSGGFHWCDEHKPFPSRPIQNGPHRG